MVTETSEDKVEVPEDKVDLVAKEIELTKLLASNDPKTRSDGIKQIKQLLLKHSGDTSDGLLYLLFISFILVFITYTRCPVRIYPLRCLLK